MDKDLLKIFYNQEQVRNAVKEYCLDTLDTLLLQDAYAKKDVSGYAEARKTVDKLFARLNEMYGERDKPLSPNRSR